MNKRKPKTCPICKKTFEPFQSMQRVCGSSCALIFKREKDTANRVKADRARTRAARERLKTPGQWKKEVQHAFNAMIRGRDALENRPCISCGIENPVQWHAGHYRPVGMGGASSLRFNEINCHRQCSQCNDHRGGNLTLYRVGLVDRIGLPLVEWLEGPHKPLNLTIEELKALKLYYKSAIKEIKRLS